MSYPPPKFEWEPIPEGVELTITESSDISFKLPMMSVRELRDDMEEAYMLSRGNERLEVMASEVLQYDKVYIGCNVLMVSDVLQEHPFKTVLQFGDSYAELTLPSDQQITVWRAVE